MMHGITPDGMDAIEDVLDCIALIVYHGETGRISAKIWRLYPQLLFVICGEESDPEGGFGFEYLA